MPHGARETDVLRLPVARQRVRIQGASEGKLRVEVSRQIRERLLREGSPVFLDRSSRSLDLDRYSDMVARTTTREGMTEGTVYRLREHGIRLAQVSAHHATDFCI